MSKPYKAMDELRNEIDRLCDPSQMSRDEYKQFCELIASEAEGRLDGIREESGEE